MNTHETYVSLEVAKLLKQAGFDWKICDGYILYEDGGSFVTEFQTPHNFNGDNGDLFNNYLHHKEVLSRPTLAIAQKWLREEKGYHISVFPETTYKEGIMYNFSIYKEDYDLNANHIYTGQTVKTYEEALEAGVKKCLEIILKEE